MQFALESINGTCIDIVHLCCFLFFSLDRGPTEVSLRVNELQKKFQQMREQIDSLSGIDMSREEQLRQMEVLRQQLFIKTQLLSKYKDTDMFDIMPS